MLIYQISSLIQKVGEGFGSCHSFGVAVGLRGYGMCQMRGASRSTIFIKMRRVGCIIFLVCPTFFFQSPSSPEAVHLSPWEIFVSKVSSVFLEHKFVRALLRPTCVYRMWRAFETPICPTWRN